MERKFSTLQELECFHETYFLYSSHKVYQVRVFSASENIIMAKYSCMKMDTSELQTFLNVNNC